MADVTITLNDSDRQMVVIALAKLSLARPGWDEALNLVARRLDNAKNGRAVNYDTYREHGPDRPTFTRRELMAMRNALDAALDAHAPQAEILGDETDVAAATVALEKLRLAIHAGAYDGV